MKVSHQKRITAGRRGRPRKDRSALVGTGIVYGHREGSSPPDGVQIVAIGPHEDGRQYAEICCAVCEKHKIQRLEHILSNWNHSCGCLETKEYKEYMARRMNELEPEKFDAIASAYHRDRNTDHVAAAFNISPRKRAMIHFVYRAWRYQLDSLPRERIREIGDFISHEGKDSAALRFNMSLSAIHYIDHLFYEARKKAKRLAAIVRRVMAERVSSTMWEVANVYRAVTSFDPKAFHKSNAWDAFKDARAKKEKAIVDLIKQDAAAEVIEKLRRRQIRPRMPVWRSQGEFTDGELRRRRNGQIAGTLRELYKRLQEPTFLTSLSPENRALADWFLGTAASTFKGRALRQQQFLRNREIESPQYQATMLGMEAAEYCPAETD